MNPIVNQTTVVDWLFRILVREGGFIEAFEDGHINIRLGLTRYIGEGQCVAETMQRAIEQYYRDKGYR